MKSAIGVILLALLSCGASSATDAKLSFKLQSGYLVVVRCSIGELENLTGIIDTGVSETVLDTRVVRRLGLLTKPDRATFLTEDVNVLAVSIPSVRLGTIESGPLAGIAADLHSLTGQFGIRPDVLIGMDVLMQSNMIIDYKHLQLSFARGPVPVMAHQASLAGSNRVASVRASLGNTQLNLQVDTGADTVLLFRSRAPEVSTAQIHLAGLSNDLIARSAETGKLQIGNWYLSHPTVLVAQAKATSDFDGVLGPRALHASRVGFDFAHKTMTWE